MIKRLLRDRKGISLTEVVVAMTIVFLITGAAISVVISSIKADAAFGNKYRALTACENAAECLRFSKGAPTEELMEKIDFKQNGDDYIFKSVDQEVTVTINDENYYVVKYNGKTIYTYYVNQASQNNGG